MLIKKYFLPFLIYIGVLLFLFSCSNQPKKEKLLPVSTLFKKAEKAYQDKDFLTAYTLYKKVRDFYPTSPQAITALLRMADIKFFEGGYSEAIPLYQEFEEFYPTNPAVPYVIFQIANCYYKMRESADRDQTFTKKALENYQRLLEEYPKNPYSKLVKKRIKSLRNLLAEHELYVAKFYYKMKYYRAAYNRLLYLISNYPETLPAKKAKKLLILYYKKALVETKDIQLGKKRDFWGVPVP